MDKVTEFTLFDTSNDDSIIYHKAYENKDLPGMGWIILEFEPEWNSSGKLYKLLIESSAIAERGIFLGYLLEKQYLEGDLLENDFVVTQDLVFRYGCATGIEKWRTYGFP